MAQVAVHGGGGLRVGDNFDFDCVRQAGAPLPLQGKDTPEKLSKFTEEKGGLFEATTTAIAYV